MRAGQLRHKIIIQQVTETPDSSGEPQESWATFKAVWASIEPLTGRELMQAQQIHADIRHKVTTRYAASVTPKMQILFGTRMFDIHSIVNVDERNITLEFLCSEHV